MEQTKIRELGETLSISIGTAIALEENLLIEKPVIRDLWINARTLIRNYLGSYEDPFSVPRKRLTEEFNNEIDNLLALLDNEQVTWTLYRTIQGRKLERIFTFAKIKEPKTDLQKRTEELSMYLLDFLKNKMGDQLKDFRTLVKGNHTTASYMLTHYPVDLLSLYEFGNLTLLESHTGATKGRYEWMSKLNSGEEYSRLPFNRLTLQVLGDKSTTFFAMRQGIRKDLLFVAEKGKWIPTTSMTKIKSDLNKYNTPSRDLLLHLTRVNLS